MSMKSKMLSLMAISMALISNSGIFNDETEPERRETEEERLLRLKRNSDKTNEANGLKKFHYGENYIYALNQKIADKKAKKKGWL